jgi:hypothetical protein
VDENLRAREVEQAMTDDEQRNKINAYIDGWMINPLELP